MKTPFHVMLIPTLGCPSKCSYCWSSDVNSPRMEIETVGEVVEWLKGLRDNQVTFTFHGGEPLLAGADFYRKALFMLAEGLPFLDPAFAIQTNLWLMTPEIAEVFSKYNIPVGSSIDGPREINDSQRGEGYFDKTLNGYRIAKEQGLDVKFICTFTAQSVEHKEEIVEFFMENGLTLKLHPALPSLKGSDPGKYALSPEKFGELLVYLLDEALKHFGEVEIMNINDLCRCVFTRHGNVCTFADCMGSTFAVGPDGSIYPCYRFVGMPEWVMGHVRDRPPVEELMASPAGKKMLAFKEYVDEHCGKCSHISYCRGGCPYNAIVPTGGEINGVDPHCPAYKRIFDEIGDRLNAEMFEAPPAEMFGFASKKKSKPGIMSLIQNMAFNRF